MRKGCTVIEARRHAILHSQEVDGKLLDYWVSNRAKLFDQLHKEVGSQSGSPAKPILDELTARLYQVADGIVGGHVGPGSTESRKSGKDADIG